MFGGPAFQVGAVMRLVDMISGPLRMIQATMAQTERGAGALSTRMAGLAQAMVPAVMVAGLLLGALGAMAMASMETDKALGELASVGVRDMHALAQAGQDFSNQWAGTTKAQFISAAYDIKGGIASLSDEGVAEFAKLAALTGKATKSTTAEMTSLFATGYGIYKQMYADLSDIQFGEVFSAGIAASVNIFKSTGSGMAQAISQLGATATSANVPLEEQLTILGMLQSTMTGSEAGTKYKALMQAAAGAGQKLKLSFMDSNKQLLSLPEILAALKGKYGDTLDAMEKMDIQKAFGTQEAVAVIDLLYGKVGDLSANIHQLGGAMQMGTGYTTKMAETMNQDLGSVLQIAKQRFHNLMEVGGKGFVPVLLWIISGVSGLTLALQRLTSTNAGKTILGLVGAAAAAVIVVAAFALIMAGASSLVAIITAQLAPLIAGLAALSWPVWVAVAAVAALYIAYRNNFGGMADVVDAFFGNLGLVVQAVQEIFSSLSGSVGSISGDLADKLQAVGLLGLVTTVAKVVYRVTGFLSELWSGFAFAAAGIGEIFTPILDSLTFAFRPLWEIIRSVAVALFGASAATDAGPWRTLGAVVGVVLGSAFKMLAWAIRIAFVPLEIIAQVIGALLWLVVGLGKGIGNAVGWIVTGFESLAQAAGTMAGRVLGWFTGMADGIKWLFLNLTPVGWLIQAFTGLGEINLFASGAKLIDTLVAGIKSKIMAPVEAVKAGFTKLRNLLPFSDAKEGPLSQLTLSGRRIMDTLGAGVSAAAPGLHKSMGTALAGAALVTSVAMAPIPAQATPMPQGIERAARQIGQAPPPRIGGREETEIAAQRRASANGGRESGRTVTIRIDNLNLPGVSNPDDFIRQLQAMVESHDG